MMTTCVSHMVEVQELFCRCLPPVIWH